MGSINILKAIVSMRFLNSMGSMNFPNAVGILIFLNAFDSMNILNAMANMNLINMIWSAKFLNSLASMNPNASGASYFRLLEDYEYPQVHGMFKYPNAMRSANLNII